MSHSKYDYVEIEDSSDFKSVRVKNLKGFLKLLQQYQVKLLFRSELPKTETSQTKDFIFLENGTFYRFDGKSYKTLEDFEEAAKSDFPDAESFYDAQQGGIFTYREYLDCKKTGVVDKQLYAKAQRYGFYDSFEKFKERCEANKTLIPKSFVPAEYDSAIKLCEYALSKGFKDYWDFDKAFFFGFSDKITFDEAKIKGYTYAEDYINAVKMGFDLIKEYQEAKHLKILSKFEYDYYNNLKNAAKGIYSFDQVVLMVALKNTDNGKKLSLKKLIELLKLKEEEIKFASKEDGSRILPEWYSKKLNNEDEFRLFLSEESRIKQYGIFDSDGEYFEVWKISNKKIYIDGSNVAFSNHRKRENPNGDDMPHFSNIKLIVEELYTQRFEEIMVIGDAGLKRKAPDLEVLTKMINDKRISYHEAPSTTEADEFFIKKAKADKCYIVSNDTFRDWKMKDTWIAENIDRIRIPFMIEGTTVTLSGIEKIL